MILEEKYYKGAEEVKQSTSSIFDKNKNQTLEKIISVDGLLKSNLNVVCVKNTYHHIIDSLNAKIEDFVIYGRTYEDDTKRTYKCDGTESGDYYFTYDNVNYQFTMPTVASGDLLVFDTTTLKLYQGTTEIATTTDNTGTLITLSATPNQDYEQEFKVVTGDVTLSVIGKNLFDGELVNGGYGTGNGAPSSVDTLYRNKNMIKVNPNTQYTLSIDGVSQKYCIYFYKEDKSFISSNVSLTTGTFTTPENTAYVNFRCFAEDYVSNFTSLKIQMELGNTATTYEYTTQTQLLSLGSIKLYRIEAKTDEIIQDYIYHNKTSNKWYKHKAINDLTVTSSQSALSIQNGSCVFSVSDIIQSNVASKVSGKKLVFANILRARNSYYRGNSQYNQIFKVYSSDAPRQVAFDIQGITTRQQVLDWVDEHELKIIYVLEEPVEEEITDTTLIAQLDALYDLQTYKNITNIFTVTDNLEPELEVRYLKDDRVGYESRLTALEQAIVAQGSNV